MISDDTNANRQPFSIPDTDAKFDHLNTKVEAWIGSKKIKNPVDKLFYQLTFRDIKPWNVSLLDRLVVESRLYIGLNEYLHGSIHERDFKTNSVQFKASVSLAIEDLIPEWDGRRAFQIYELKITDNTIKNDLLLGEEDSLLYRITAISFDYAGGEQQFLFNGKYSGKLEDGIVFNARNIVLANYNYELLDK